MCRVIAGLGPAVGDASALGVGTHRAAAEPVFWAPMCAIFTDGSGVQDTDVPVEVVA